MSWLADKRIVVTGGAGFLGSNVIKKLEERGCKEIFIPRSKDYNLVEIEAVKSLYRDARPDIVIHLAARVGGIGANMNNPGSFFYENLMMGVQLIEQGRQAGIEKFVAIGTICAYPKFTPVPFKEEDLWNGYPEETNAPYGLAKKMLLVQSQAYRQQYSFNAIYLLPVNLYGPGDNFDLKTSHVLPALMRKIHEAKLKGAPEAGVWGTGTPLREFLHVDDLADALLFVMLHYDGYEIINVGGGEELTIRDLCELIREVVGYTGRIAFDPNMPDGTPRKALDVSRLSSLGWRPKIQLRSGIEETYRWYCSTLP